jgi:hypothetical protein
VARGKQAATQRSMRAAARLQEEGADAMDALAEFEEFREAFLPAIRRALMDGLSSEQILKKFEPVMAARLVQLGATGAEAASLNAIKEILDRTQGKAVQKQEHTHRLAKLPEEELDAVLASKLQRLSSSVVLPATDSDDSKDEADKP